jgi:hypothetical protein
MLYVPEIHVEAGPPVTVRSPYHPDWPQRAKALGGQWDPGSKTWRFDPRDLDRVREALLDIYGWDGTYLVEILDARLLLDKIPTRRATLWMFGRLIAERRERDTPVRLGPGVVPVCGGFPGSGGRGRTRCSTPSPEPSSRCAASSPDSSRTAGRGGLRASARLPGTRRTLFGPGEATGAGVSQTTGWPRRRIVIHEERS